MPSNIFIKDVLAENLFHICLFFFFRIPLRSTETEHGYHSFVKSDLESLIKKQDLQGKVMELRGGAEVHQRDPEY